LFARVIIEREEAKISTKLIIPDSVKERHQPAKGILVAVGEGVCESVKKRVGKLVIYGKFAGAEIEVNGKKFWICQDEDLLGVEDVRTIN